MASDGCEWKRGDLIGRGAFGSVFLAHPKYSSSFCGSRLLPPVFVVKSAKLLVSETLKNEIKVFNDLQSSPYIITCFGAESVTDKDNGKPVYNLLLEYASGGSIDDLIQNSFCGVPVPFEDVKRYTRQLLLGLSHVHDTGYVHCDIKPDNILLVPSGDGDFDAKISDFGLAKNTRLERRELGDVRGTPLYLAPECVVDGVQDCAADIWALGCVVCEMLTGESVWPPGKKGDLYSKIANEEPHIGFSLPGEALDFLKACLVRKPEHRPTAKMLLEHPFLTGLIEEEDDEDEEDEEESVETVADNGCQQVDLEAENCCLKDEFKVIETVCEELKAENGCVKEKIKVIGTDCGELKAAENGCEEEEEDPEELEEVVNGCEEEVGSSWISPKELMLFPCPLSKDDMIFPEELQEVRNGCEEEVVGSSWMFDDDDLRRPPKELMLFPCSSSKDDMIFPACKRRRISHSKPITGSDLTLAPPTNIIAAGQ